MLFRKCHNLKFTEDFHLSYDTVLFIDPIYIKTHTIQTPKTYTHLVEV